jgi:ribonuclease PH
MSRVDGREESEMRPIEVTLGFLKHPPGSVLYRAGGTKVLVNASVVDEAPEWLAGGGWLTAEYHMHPCAGPKRQGGAKKRKGPDGRATEIQRLIGRTLRAGVVLESIGPRTIVLDCDVLEADGGTRTACINAGTIATALALEWMRKKGMVGSGVLRSLICATSVGRVSGKNLVDLCYVEDSKAELDLNVVGTATGLVAEIQGAAEGPPVPRQDLDALVDLALGTFPSIADAQRHALSGVELEKLFASR